MSGLTELKRKIATERGLDCDQFKENFLLRRLAARMRHTHQPSLGAYSRFLDRDAGEYARLLAALSINVTQFFRDDSTFRLIRTKLVPALFADAAAPRRRALRIWSAGCATGQETYSLAILLAEALERRPGGIAVHVYGTDIDAEAVTYARRGVYAPAEMDGVAGAYALRHFVANGHYRASPEIRRLVRFRVHDLMKDPPLRYVDLLLCRNVLIYLSASRESRRRLFDIFGAALRPGGFLILGKTEAVSRSIKGCFTPVDVKERVYQKVSTISALRGGL